MQLKRYERTVILFFFCLWIGQGIGQTVLFEKRKLTETEISTFMSYYKQDGDHSAITGGKGTEKLSVFSLSTEIVHTFDSSRHFRFDLGFDIISSASTDKIDFKVSSASKRDQRIYASVGYDQRVSRRDITVGGNISISTESDFLSWGINSWASYTSPTRNSSIDLSFQMYKDDLRWRKNFFKPTELIYPEELRDTSWFTGHTRQSYNVRIGIRRDINKTLSIGLFSGFVYQSGILATPFHRVYFQNSVEPKVESLPASRKKIPLGIQVNKFLFHRLALRSSYQYYWDDLGITSHMINIDIPYKISTYVTLTPSLRYYEQSASNYFQPFKEHLDGVTFYTSDYDLSDFHSWKFGMELKSSSLKEIFKHKWLFDLFALRYSYYRRSDGLYAHIFTTLFDIKKSNLK